MLGRIRISADQQYLPVRTVRKAGPHFLAVNDKIITINHCAGLESRQVGAGTGLRISLTPNLFGSEHLRQKAVFLLFGAERHQGKANAVERELIRSVQR